MAADVGTMVIDILVRRDEAEAALRQNGRAFEEAAGRAGRAGTQIERSAARAAQGIRNFSYQLGDIGTQVGSGTSPFIIIAQQSSQVQQALQEITTSGATLGQVLKGIALPGALALLAAFTPLIAKMFEGRDAAISQADAYKALSKAVDEYTAGIGNAANGEYVKIRLLELGTKAILAQEIATRRNIKAQIEAAEASAKAGVNRPDFNREFVVQNLPALRGQLAAQDARIAEAEKRARIASGNRIAEDVKANSRGQPKLLQRPPRLLKPIRTCNSLNFVFPGNWRRAR